MFRFFTCFTQHTHGRTRPKFNMPPKKKAKTLEGQQKLTFSAFSNSNEHHRRVSAGDFVPLAAEAAQASAIDSAPSSNNSSTASNQTKARKFFSSWMKTYSWLAYDEKEDYMYCKVCTEHKKKNGMCKVARCKNFQNTTLVRHAALSDHQMALQKPQIPKQFEAIKEKAESQQNKAVMVLLKCVHWLCVEGLPLVQFKSLLELLHDLGLEDIAILKQSANIHYESYTTYNDILDCLSDLLEDELKERLSKSSVVTVLADESTDIANVKRLDIYTQIISEEMKPSTHYVTNIECTDSTGVGIANEIMSEFHKIGVSCNTCTTGVNFGSAHCWV